MQKRVLAIVGPTAVGKSALALTLAPSLNGEIVSADSRQVYRYMDVGTAKPTPEERSAVPHHIIDVVDPDGEYNLAIFLRQATEAISDIQDRSKLPVLVGGTGQYVWALLEGWRVPPVPPNPGLRSRLEERAGTDGPSALHRELSKLDPAAASRVDPRNVRRLIRALEVAYSAPNGEAVVAEKRPPRYETKLLGLTLERSALYDQIDRRVDAMVELGWRDEVKALLARGYGPELPSLSSVGYRELVRSMRGELSLDEAIQRIKHSTHRFARHQYAWFRPADSRISWLNANGAVDWAATEVSRWLEG